MLKNKHQIILLLIVVLVSLIPVEVFATSSNLDIQIDELELLLDSLYQEKANIEESVDVIKPIKSSTPTELDFEIQLLEVQKSDLEDKLDYSIKSKVNSFVEENKVTLLELILLFCGYIIISSNLIKLGTNIEWSSVFDLYFTNILFISTAMIIFTIMIMLPSKSDLERNAHSYIESEVSEHFYSHQNQNMVTTFFVENNNDMKTRKMVALEQEVKILDSKIDFLQNLELKPKNVNKK